MKTGKRLSNEHTIAASRAHAGIIRIFCNYMSLKELKTILPNYLLGDYRILELIGEGGQGMVYKAFDTKLKRIVAIKIFHPKNDENRSQKLASFKYEARLASALDHPNICRIYALIEEGDTACTVMEYIEGKNLFDTAYGRPLEINSAVEIVLQVADALVAAHARGIIHRDIKPRNVMVNDAGRAVVLDFGMAKLSGNPAAVSSFDGDKTAREIFYEDIAESLFITMDGMPYGTPSTSPPEMARGLPTDERGDVYAVGGLLYLLLTGTYAFLADTLKETLRKVIHEEPEPVTVARRAEGLIPLELVAVVRRALRKDPDERFQQMIELRDQLARVLTEINMVEKVAGDNSGFRASALPATHSPEYARPLPKVFNRSSLRIILAVALLITVILACFIF